MDLELDAAPDM